MKIELSEKELKDIYEDLTASVLEDSSVIDRLEEGKSEKYKDMLNGYKNRQNRRMILINKIAKLVGYQDN